MTVVVESDWCRNAGTGLQPPLTQLAIGFSWEGCCSVAVMTVCCLLRLFQVCIYACCSKLTSREQSGAISAVMADYSSQHLSELLQPALPIAAAPTAETACTAASRQASPYCLYCCRAVVISQFCHCWQMQHAFGSITQFLPLPPTFGGNSPVQACFRHSMIVCTSGQWSGNFRYGKRGLCQSFNTGT